MQALESTPRDTSRVVELRNQAAAGDVLVVCEHACNAVPSQLNDLGLDAAALTSHIAWDPGALAVADGLSRHLDAALIASCVSRLVYDCNRPPDAPDAMPERSEHYIIPGNQRLSASDRECRTHDYYAPFERLLSETINTRNLRALVTLHTFTPVYLGRRRGVQIGVLHGEDSRLADAMLARAPRHSDLLIKRNAPYGPDDGVCHTLDLHGARNGIANVMIEIRNDLVTDDSAQQAMALMLCGWIASSVAGLAERRAS